MQSMVFRTRRPVKRVVDIIKRRLPRVPPPKRVAKMVATKLAAGIGSLKGFLAFFLFMTFSGRKMSKDAHRRFRTLDKTKALKVLSSFKRVLGNLMKTLQGRKQKTRRSVDTVPFLLLIMGVAVIATTVTTRDGTVYVTMAPQDVGKWLAIRSRLGNSSCILNAMDVGSMCDDSITYECPVINDGTDPEDIDCYCKGLPIVVTYGRCKNATGATTKPTNRRSRRSIALAPHGTGGLHHGDAVTYKTNNAKRFLMRLENWALRNPGYVAVILILSWMMGNTNKQRAVYVLLMLMIAPVYGHHCSGVSKRDFIQGVSGGTWVDLVLDTQTCVTIVTPGKPTFDFKLNKIEISKLAKVREYCLQASITDTTTVAGCPSTTEAHNDKRKDALYLCERSYPDRGWGNGCGLFGRGSLDTCAKFACSKKFSGHMLQRENLAVVITMAVQGGSGATGDDSTKRKSRNELAEVTVTPQAPYVEGDFADYGKVGLECSIDVGVDINEVYTGDAGGKWWMVKRAWFQDLALPWSSPAADFWHDRDRLMEWGTPHATKQSVYTLGDQEGSLISSLADAPSIVFNTDKVEFEVGRVKCRVKMENAKLKGSTYLMCKQAFTFEKRPVATNHGTVIFQVKYANADAPCRVPVAIKELHGAPIVGGLVSYHPIVLKQNDVVTIEIEPPFGDSVIEVGDDAAKLTEAWHREGSSIGEAFHKTMKGIQRLTVMGDAAWDFGSVGGFFRSVGKAVHSVLGGLFNTLFGGMSWISKILIGVLLVWLGISARDHTLAVAFMSVGGILLYLSTLSAAASEVGCSLDMTRHEIKCGDGVFLFRDVNGWRDRYVFHPGSPRTLAAALWTAWNAGICGARSTTRMEHEMWKQIENELNGILEENDIALSVVVKATNGTYPRGWKRIPRNETGLLHGWKTWGKTKLVTVPLAKNVFVVDGADEGECESLQRSWNTFKVEEFGTGIMKTKVFLDVNNKVTDMCDTELLGAAVKGNRSAHGDPGLWLTASVDSGEWGLDGLSLSESRRCLWPDSHTVWGRGVEDSKLILPPSLGGPVSHMNTRKGYSTQVNGPWNNVPLDVVFEKCPGTTVNISATCRTRTNSARSTTDSGRIIPEWCCRSCTMPPLTYRTPDGCWYAMEIQPMNTKEESILRARVSAGLVAGLDNFSLGFLVLMLATQEGLKRRWTSKHVLLTSIALLLAMIVGDITYMDLGRYMITLGAMFAEMNSGGDVMHLALVATFRVKPAYLLGFLWRNTWSPRESMLLTCGAILMQMGMGVLACHHLMDYIHALALGWLFVRAIVVRGMASKAMPLICCMVPLTATIVANATRAGVITLAIGTMVVGQKGKAVKKAMPYLASLVGAWAGLNPLYMMVIAGLMIRNGRRSWPAGEIMSAVGLTCAMVGAISGASTNELAGPAAAAALIFTAYAISGRANDIYIEKAGEISWNTEAQVSGSSPRVDVKVTEGGDFSAPPRDGRLVAKNWNHWSMPCNCRHSPFCYTRVRTALVRPRGSHSQTWRSSLGCAITSPQDQQSDDGGRCV
ncbi:truncated polyprotein [Ilomantsi virus]|uniref:truncated polyprotein n=2 Tax=Ilomantsi virus TaxID=1445557 RepID=UPI0008073BB1|nr:truncated polyprotein [Ilomantsi virus]